MGQGNEAEMGGGSARLISALPRIGTTPFQCGYERRQVTVGSSKLRRVLMCRRKSLGNQPRPIKY